MKKYYFLFIFILNISLHSSDSYTLQDHLEQVVYPQINQQLDNDVNQGVQQVRKDLQEKYGNNVRSKSISELTTEINKDLFKSNRDYNSVIHALHGIIETPYPYDNLQQSQNLTSLYHVLHDRIYFLNFWKQQLIEQNQSQSAMQQDSLPSQLQVEETIQPTIDDSLQEQPLIDAVVTTKIKKKKKPKLKLAESEQPSALDVLKQQAEAAKQKQREADLKRNAELKELKLQKEAEAKQAEMSRRSQQRKKSMLKAVGSSETVKKQQEDEDTKNKEEAALLLVAYEQVQQEKSKAIQENRLQKDLNIGFDSFFRSLQIPAGGFNGDDNQIDHSSFAIANMIVLIENMVRQSHTEDQFGEVIEEIKLQYLDQFDRSYNNWKMILQLMQSELSSSQLLLTYKIRNSQGIHEPIDMSCDDAPISIEDSKLACGFLAIKIGKIKQVLNLIEMMKTKLISGFASSQSLEPISRPEAIARHLNELARLMRNALTVGEDEEEQKVLLARVMSPETSKVWSDRQVCLDKTDILINQAEKEYAICKGTSSNYMVIKNCIDARHDMMCENLTQLFDGLSQREIALLLDLEMVLIDVLFNFRHKAV